MSNRYDELNATQRAKADGIINALASGRQVDGLWKVNDMPPVQYAVHQPHQVPSPSNSLMYDDINGAILWVLETGPYADDDIEWRISTLQVGRTICVRTETVDDAQIREEAKHDY